MSSMSNVALAAWMHRRRLTRTAAATQLGLTERAIYALLRGERRVSRQFKN
jgi:plasmid maintenance system antidote protein VapI